MPAKAGIPSMKSSDPSQGKGSSTGNVRVASSPSRAASTARTTRKIASPANAPMSDATPVSIAPIDRICFGVAPAKRNAASRRSRCAAQTRVHIPMKMSAGIKSNQQPVATPGRNPGSFSMLLV